MRAPSQGGGCPPPCGIFFAGKPSRPTWEYVRKKSLAETNPELAAEIHPDSDIKATEVTAGNNIKRLLWLCDRNHTWRTTAGKRSRGSGCPYCSGRVATTGVNDLATVNPKLAAQVHPDSDIKADEIMPNSGKSPLWLCHFGHSWRDTTAHRSAGRGCPYCSNKRVLKGFNDLATVNPALASEVSPNSKTTAAEVTRNSSKKLLWLCKSGHEWETTSSHRLEGNGCPYCSGRKPIAGETDLATTNPELASQVHPDSPIKACEVTKGSKAKLLWECPLGHSWKAAVWSRDRGRNCPYCAGKKVLKGFNDLATTHPKLASEISPSSPVQPDEVTAGSRKKAIWVCKSGHQWTCGICSRTNGSGCPHCDGRKLVVGVNDLQTINPALASQVSPKSPIKATEVMAGSGKILLWECKRKHIWASSVCNRKSGYGCPYCSGQIPIPGETDLATINPKLASEVSKKSKIRPEQVTANSGKKLLWECRLGHEWTERVTARSRGFGCPYCSGQRVMKGFNDLKTKYPSLAKEVSEKSPMQADEVTCGSNKKLVWKCKNNHEWAARISHRISGSGCPQCAGSQAERDLAELVKSLLPENVKILRNDRKVIKPYELDILVPSLDLAFEFNGTYWHSDEVIKATKSSFPSSKAFDDFKKTECAKQGINLFFVREKPWTENHDKEVKRVEKIVATALKKAA